MSDTVITTILLVLVACLGGATGYTVGYDQGVKNVFKDAHENGLARKEVSSTGTEYVWTYICPPHLKEPK